MKDSEITSKIQELLSSGQNANTQLALQLMESQLDQQLEETLSQLERNYQLKADSRTGEDFYLNLRLGPILLEYDYSKRYAPYVGSIERASRKVGIERVGQIQYQVNMNQYWEVKEWEAEAVKALFEEDYLQLIPYLAQTIYSEINA
jgi:hypothetical protein